MERLKACSRVAPKQIERLEETKTELNPFGLKETIEKKLRRVLQSANNEASRLAA